MDKDKFIGIGMLGSISLFSFYLLIASLLGGIDFALDNFAQLWKWMTPLILLFGAQIGLFFYMKEEMHKKATAEAAASTGISTASMIACCAHHIADVAPFLGIAALGLFLTKYQTSFLLIGIASNILGMTYMLSMMRSHVSKVRLKTVFYSLLAIAIVGIFLSFYSTSSKTEVTLQTQTNNANNVEFQVTPLSTSEFQIVIDTHSVTLDFDLTKISMLQDNLGNNYNPTAWDGSAPGGHHRSGILKFPAINSNAKSITLTITDSTERVFEWGVG